MTLVKALTVCLVWLLTPANIVSAGVSLSVGLGVGYLKGHGVATRQGDTRVETAVKHIEDTLEKKAKTNVQSADTAADAVTPVPPSTELPRSNRPDRAVVQRLCQTDPACRRDGS